MIALRTAARQFFTESFRLAKIRGDMQWTI
jgi:hypothetical protein